MDKEAMKYLDTLISHVIKYLGETKLRSNQTRQPIEDLFNASSAGQVFAMEDDIIDLSVKGSRKHRKAVMQTIYTYLDGELKIREKVVDKILSGYYINYYGSAEDITSSADNVTFVNQINRILIPKSSPREEKIKKLARVCYQEIHGLGPLDQFFDLPPDQNMKKVEEIAYNGPNQLSLKISGVNVKLDKIHYEESKCRNIANRLSRCSNKSLTKRNTNIETQLLDNSRVYLSAPNYSVHYNINIRRHYAFTITREMKVQLGSSTWEYEHFWDYAMKFKPRVLIIGGQGVGKSTDIVDLASRFPRNTVVVTGETSQELNLEKLGHLTVIPTFTNILKEEEYLKSLFRYNADCLILGEARTPVDVMLMTQMAQRQEFGTMGTWHESDADGAIYGMANALVRGGYALTLSEALHEITKSFDFIIVKGICDETFGANTGLRHIKQLCEVPKVPTNFSGDVVCRPLFQYNYSKMKLENVNTISEDLQRELLKRSHNPSAMEVLRNGKYY